MSFGYSGGDIVLLAQLAWNVVQGARKACGEHDELARELSGLHTVLQRLRIEFTDVKSPLHRCDAERREELEAQINDCERLLKVVDKVLTKYNALEDCERSGKKLWQKIRFGNGETKDLADIRTKICIHTQAITMTLNLISLGSQGRIETQLSHQGRDVSGIRESVNWIVAKMAAVPEASVMTNYTNDSKAFWREMRRELVSEGYTSFVIQKHKSLIKEYVKELGDRGVLDEHSGMYSKPLTHSQQEVESLNSNLAGPHEQNQVMTETESLYSIPNQAHTDKRDNQEITVGNGPTIGTEVLLEGETIPTLDEETTRDPEGRDQARRSSVRRVRETDKRQDVSQTRNYSLVSGGPSNGDVNSQTFSDTSELGNEHLSDKYVKGQQFQKDLEDSRTMLEQLNTSPSKPELTGAKNDGRAGYNGLSETLHETKDQIVYVVQTSASSEPSTSVNTSHERVSRTEEKSLQIIQPYHPDLSNKEEEKIEEERTQTDARGNASAKITNLVLPGLDNTLIQFVDNFESLSVPNRSMDTNNRRSNLEFVEACLAHGLLKEFTLFYDHKRGRVSHFHKKLESPLDIIEFVEQYFVNDDVIGPWVQSGSPKVIDTQDKSRKASMEWRSQLSLGLWIGIASAKQYRTRTFTFSSIFSKNSNLEVVDTMESLGPYKQGEISIFIKHWAAPFRVPFRVNFLQNSRISWEFMIETLKFVYFNFENYCSLFEGGHFNLLNREGEIIRPELWSSLVQSELYITLVMREPPITGGSTGTTPSSLVNVLKEQSSDSSEYEYVTWKSQWPRAGGSKNRNGKRRRKRPVPVPGILGTFFGI